MRDLAAVLLGNGEKLEADMDCRQLSGNYVKEGIKETLHSRCSPGRKRQH